MQRRLHVGMFEREGDLMRAARECRERSLPIVDAYSPYPLHGIDPLIGIARSRLTLVCFLGGLAGLTIALFFQYWTSALDWPTNVGGKPYDSLPAFLPIAFEMTVLLAGLATAFALLARSRLWPGKRAPKELRGTTDNRYALVVAEESAELAPREMHDMFTRHGAVEAWEELE
ncbi:MAG: DUF3341 domain-containing protein [bacterium]|nr:DUF3341 domain-containing protein [bacterium]